MAWRRVRTDFRCDRCAICTSKPYGSPAPQCERCLCRMRCVDQPCNHPAHKLVVDILKELAPTQEHRRCYCWGCRRYLVRVT